MCEIAFIKADKIHNKEEIMLNPNTDIIRINNSDYANINTQNRFIQKMMELSAEDAFSFRLIATLIGRYEQTEQMENTYWMRVPLSDNNQYGEDVNMAVIK